MSRVTLASFALYWQQFHCLYPVELIFMLTFRVSKLIFLFRICCCLFFTAFNVACTRSIDLKLQTQLDAMKKKRIYLKSKTMRSERNWVEKSWKAWDVFENDVKFVIKLDIISRLLLFLPLHQPPCMFSLPCPVYHHRHHPTILQTLIFHLIKLSMQIDLKYYLKYHATMLATDLYQALAYGPCYF